MRNDVPSHLQKEQTKLIITPVTTMYACMILLTVNFSEMVELFLKLVSSLLSHFTLLLGLVSLND